MCNRRRWRRAGNKLTKYAGIKACRVILSEPEFRVDKDGVLLLLLPLPLLFAIPSRRLTKAGGCGPLFRRCCLLLLLLLFLKEHRDRAGVLLQRQSRLRLTRLFRSFFFPMVEWCGWDY